MLWGKMLSFMLTPAWEIQILRARLVEAAGVEAVHAVDPGSPAAGPVIDPPGAPYGALTDELVSAYRGAVGEALLGAPGLGSNNWAIAPERTDTGRALFACDPHLSAVFPSNGYFVHLDCPEFTVAGASVPGLPGIIWGHNRRIAWGPTASLASVQDLVLEEFEPDSDRYRTSEGWAEASVVEETIQVRGHPSETARVRITRHGPVVSPELPGVRHALALRSPILGTATSGQGLLGLLTASNVDEFREAVAGFEDFNLAFGYADVDGHIGVQTSGLIPARPPGSAWLPLRGWESESELGGGAGEGEDVCVPFERLPHTFDPPGGLVWSANNPPEPIEQLPFDGEFLDAYRAQRIGQGIEAVPHMFEAARALQVDRYSIPGVRLQSHMATIEAQDDRERKLFAQVASWDGVMASDSVAAAVVSTTFSRLLDAVLRTKIGDVVEVYVGHVHAIPNLNMLTARGASLVLDLLDEGPPDWFGPAREGVSGREVWTAVLTRSFREGVDLLRSRLGRDPARWTWGRCHQLTSGARTARRTGDGAAVRRWPVRIRRGREYGVPSRASGRRSVRAGQRDPRAAVDRRSDGSAHGGVRSGRWPERATRAPASHGPAGRLDGGPHPASAHRAGCRGAGGPAPPGAGARVGARPGDTGFLGGQAQAASKAPDLVRDQVRTLHGDEVVGGGDRHVHAVRDDLGDAGARDRSPPVVGRATHDDGGHAQSGQARPGVAALVGGERGGFHLRRAGQAHAFASLGHEREVAVGVERLGLPGVERGARAVRVEHGARRVPDRSATADVG